MMVFALVFFCSLSLSFFLPVNNQIDYCYFIYPILCEYMTLMIYFVLFFLSGFSFTDTNVSQDCRKREGTNFYSTLPLPPAHKYSDIYLKLCMWDDYHIFLIATLLFTRLLLNEIYYLIELPFCFCYSNLTWETGGFELTLTTTLVLQANRLSKCASHPYCNNGTRFLYCNNGTCYYFFLFFLSLPSLYLSIVILIYLFHFPQVIK